MSVPKTKSVVEGGILSAVAIILSLISTYVPVVGGFVNFIWPVPFILLGVRHGLRSSVTALVASGILIGILTYPLKAVSFILGFGLVGVALGWAFDHRLSPARILLVGAVVSLISKMLLLGFSIWFLRFNPITELTNALTQSVPLALDMYRRIGLTDAQLQPVAALLEQLTQMAPLIIPAAFVMGAVLDTFINYVVAKGVLRKLGQHVEELPPFKYWMLPRYVLAGYLLGMILQLAGQYYSQAVLTRVGLNLLMLFMFVLLVQGLAVGSFYADRYNIPRFVKTLLIFLILTNNLFGQIAVWVGIFDLILDYRRIRVET